MRRDGAGRGERWSAWGGAEIEEEARKRRGGEERRRGVVAWGREERDRAERERGEGAGEEFFFCISCWRTYVMGAGLIFCASLKSRNRYLIWVRTVRDSLRMGENRWGNDVGAISLLQTGPSIFFLPRTGAAFGLRPTEELAGECA